MQTEKEIKNIFEGIRRQLTVHAEMGLDPPPVLRETFAAPESGPAAEQHRGILPASPKTLRDLLTRIGDCRGCKLAENRSRLVFGEGSPRAKIVFVGEGPGREEDLAGRPFVGEAGKLLTRIIENGMGLRRERVYICNVVKCHPPRNRDPEKDELEACLPFLKQQLRIIGPEVICALGRVAGQGLLGDQFSITRERGRWREYDGIPLLPTFHPAYLLRNPGAKRQVWEDVKQVMKFLGLEVKKNV
jgi:DNA polymerase